jgi:hypothetical protein
MANAAPVTGPPAASPVPAAFLPRAAARLLPPVALAAAVLAVAISLVTAACVWMR